MHLLINVMYGVFAHSAIWWVQPVNPESQSEAQKRGYEWNQTLSVDGGAGKPD